MKGVYKTPGVYIEEKNAFSTSIVAVPTAVPAFIGYTEKALNGTQSLLKKPTKIESFAEYERFFGGAPDTKVKLKADENGAYAGVEVDNATRFFMYYSMKLFYSNGGGPCYIVSMGTYKDGENPRVKDGELLAEGIQKLLKYPEPTMLVLPDAVLLEQNTACYELQNQMIDHCGTEMRSRIALLDVFDGYQEEDADGNPIDAISNFRNGITSKPLDFAAAYYPWLYTTVVSPNDVSANNMTDKAKLVDMLKAGFPTDTDDEETNERNAGIQATIDNLNKELGDDFTAEDLKATEAAVKTISPLYKDILKDVREELGLMPPSGAIAGLISYVDDRMGVARSPANVSLEGVSKPSIAISDKKKEDLNLPLNGKAVNAIRAFQNKGILVSGARTMDGNSQDWRYIVVRRAVIMIEQSIKIAMGAFVFEPNNQNTWLDVSGSITNFLTAQWTNGILVGNTPGEAFSVDVGLGTTMTPSDILDGIMRINIKLAVVRPAEFIVITFEQKMQTS
jgi:phage tail sheath protein FI